MGETARPVAGGDETVAPEATPYQLTLAALTVPWGRQTLLNLATGAAFALVAGPQPAAAWALALCAADLVLGACYRRLAPGAAAVPSQRGLTWLSILIVAKGLVWYLPPLGFVVLRHEAAGLVFLMVQAVGLTALSVSTARNSQRLFLAMCVTPLLSLAAGVLAILGPVRGAGPLADIVVMAALLWVIGAGTSRVVAEWNRASDHRRQAMAEMREALARSELAEARLSEALGRAEAASRAKSDFLATMSHEIRTPLNAVLGMAQAMARDQLSDAQRDRLQMIGSAGESLLALLNDLLDLSKIEAGRVELETGVVEAEALAAGARAYAPLLQDKDVSLTVTVAPSAEGAWAGDPARVRQVLNNLVSNAVKFTQRGEIAVRIGHDGEALVLEVADTGMGIPAASLDQVFEPFVQADASTTRRHGGSGLGLTICRDLVRLMGGTIALESREGVGTTFTVRLPLRRAAARAEATAPPPPPRAPVLGSLRVLAAEDNPMNQVVLRTLLQAADIEPLVVADGLEALQAWRTGAWDVILMDVQMPVMDGVAATRAIRAAERDEDLRRTPIIALTANAMDHHRDEYLGAGMDALVAKPINLADLLTAIAAAIDPEAEGPAEAAKSA